jgi:hypothetical protein
MGSRSKESLVSLRLRTPFQKELFAAALKGLEQLDNPLRANNFATGLRELLRILLVDLAPDNQVKACEWFKPETQNGNPFVVQRDVPSCAILALFNENRLAVRVKCADTKGGQFTVTTTREECCFDYRLKVRRTCSG